MICYDLIFVHIRMNYYYFNRQELLQIAKDKYTCGHKEKAAEYCIANKEVLRANAKNKNRNLWEKKKEV